MNLGESKTINIPADEAYGPHHKERVLVVDRGEIPADLNQEVGQQLQIRYADGRTAVVMVTEVSESAVTLDGNHPLAGKDLTFEIQLLESA